MWGIYMCMCRFWPLSVMLHLPPPPRRHRFRPPAKPKNNIMIVTSSSDEYLLLIFINSFLKITQGKYLPTIWHQSARRDRRKQKHIESSYVPFSRFLPIGHRFEKEKEGTFKKSVVQYLSM